MSYSSSQGPAPLTPAGLIAAAAGVLNPRRTSGGLIGDVGCALLTRSGKLFLGVCAATGSNTFCAETAAMAAMLTAGESLIEQIVAVWRDEAGALFVISPCGNCRQLMFEIDAENLESQVILDQQEIMCLKELLPQVSSWRPQT